MDKHRVILDTDIGDDVDDAYALALLICSPEIQLDAVTINTGKVDSKAKIARRMLDLAGLKEVPVYRGLPGPDPSKEHAQAEWARNYRSEGIIADDGVGELVKRAAASPGEITLLAIGPLTNIGAALDKDAGFGRNLRQLIIMGGSVVHGYEYGKRNEEYNIVHDVSASKKAFGCGANLTVVPLDATNKLQVTPRRMAQLAVCNNPICRALLELTALYEGDHPTMHDPRTCAVLLHERLAAGVDMRLEIGSDGRTDHASGEANCKVVLEPKAGLLFRIMWERYLAGPACR
jgi:inosine-uridine nucleoside N-ribohydrolase